MNKLDKLCMSCFIGYPITGGILATTLGFKFIMGSQMPNFLNHITAFFFGVSASLLLIPTSIMALGMVFFLLIIVCLIIDLFLPRKLHIIASW
jgi:hypothetical protein